MSIERPYPDAASGQRLAIAAVMLLVLGVYVAYTTTGVGDALYAYSKTLASYDIRRHLGMSKRYLLQYGHVLFLFILLALLPFVVSPRASGWPPIGLLRRVLNRYAFPTFMFHYPLLYLAAAAIDHDPTSTRHQALLFTLVITACVLLSELCYALKPALDRVGGAMKRGARYADASLRTEPPARIGELAPSHMSAGFSAAIDWVKIVATFAVIFGHFSFPVFTSLNVPGFSGAAPRFAVPLFFMVSGYLAVASLDRAQRGLIETIVRRWWSYMFVVVPMLLTVPIMDWVGFSLDSSIYESNVKFIDPVSGEGGPADLRGFLITAVNSLLFLNEIWIYNLFGFGTPEGGVGTFSNDPFWFMCYLVPFMVLLSAAWALRGVRRAVVLLGLMLLIGPPVLMLAPLYFSGVAAYMLHRRWFPGALDT